MHKDEIALTKLPEKNGVTTAEKNEDEIEKKANALVRFIESIVRQEPDMIAAIVETARANDPESSNDEFARKLVSRYAIRSGLFGGLTSIGGFMTLPVAVPTDLIYSIRAQSRMMMAVAHCYGYDIYSPQMVDDILIVIVGNPAREALKKAGIEVAQGYTKKAIQKHLTRDVMKRVNRIVSRKLLTKAGEKSATSFMKMVPLVGAPVGFGINFTATQVVGRQAIKFYGP